MKEVEIIAHQGELVAKIICDIDHHTAKAVRECIDAELRCIMPKQLIMDFSEVDFMDSSGIGLILGRVSELDKIGATLLVRGLSEYHTMILRMAGIEKIKGVELRRR